MYTISSAIELPIGCIIDSAAMDYVLSDRSGNEHHTVRFFVIRNVTREEHIACYRDEIADLDWLLRQSDERHYFYEISMD